MSDNTEQALIESFQLMWGNYHEPVRLIHKSFRVVAANQAYLQAGGQVGGRCNAANPELHRGCRAMAALREHVTQITTDTMDGVAWVNYWVPVGGPDSEYFVHFTNGMNAFAAKQAAKTGAN